MRSRASGLFNPQLASIQFLAIGFLYGLFGLVHLLELQKRKAAAFLGERIQDHIALLDGSVRGQQCAQVLFTGLVGEIGNVEVVTGVLFFLLGTGLRHFYHTMGIYMSLNI